MENSLVSELLHYCNIRVNGCNKMTSITIDYYDFTFVVDGSMTYIVNGKRYELRKNDAVFLPPQTVRAREAGTVPVKYVSFNFRTYPGTVFPFDVFMSKCITENMKTLISVFPESHLIEQYHSREKCVCMLQYLLFELLDAVTLVSSNPHILKMLKFIDERPHELISLEDISRYTNLSKEYCSYLFQKEMHKSLIYYINERKMRIAKDLLINNEMSLREISAHLGYENYNYFSRLFKKYFGVPPVRMKR